MSSYFTQRWVVFNPAFFRVQTDRQRERSLTTGIIFQVPKVRRSEDVIDQISICGVQILGLELSGGNEDPITTIFEELHFPQRFQHCYVWSGAILSFNLWQTHTHTITAVLKDDYRTSAQNLEASLYHHYTVYHHIAQHKNSFNH